MEAVSRLLVWIRAAGPVDALESVTPLNLREKTA